MIDGNVRAPEPRNEPVLSYAPGTPERASLKAKLQELAGQNPELPLYIGGKEISSGTLTEVHCPHRKKQVLARFHVGTEAHTLAAIDAASAAHGAWSRMPWTARAAVFLRAAELLSGKYRATINAATMLGQSKTAYQAEIDAACELADFLRWNVHYLTKIQQEQPFSPPGNWNLLDHRPLEGFVLAVTPFNFTAIAGNLPSAPALMGNTVVWKPASTAALSAWYVLQLFREAGLPEGVINLVWGEGPAVSGPALAHPSFAGLHFTGSTGVFNRLWSQIASNLSHYREYPRVVGETGGKDFILAHASADVDALAVAIVRGGYEYQGQKCSAASRVYVPDSLWPALRERVSAMMAQVRVGPVEDFRNFVGAVIDERAFRKHSHAIAEAKSESNTYEVIAGGTADDREGWFVQPTLLRTSDPRCRLMVEELFGPIVTLYVYPEAQWNETLTLLDTTSPYALTGAIFARDRAVIEQALSVLRHSAGNLYINDKPTGAVVGQQPFGGGRASGTNDKAGSALNLLRWVSPRAIKENLAPPTQWTYPFLAEE